LKTIAIKIYVIYIPSDKVKRIWETQMTTLLKAATYWATA
jgi:hypothetical protein